MIFQKFAIFSVVASLAAGQVNIGPEDIPKECTAVCADVVSIAKRCDDQNGKHTPTRSPILQLRAL